MFLPGMSHFPHPECYAEIREWKEARIASVPFVSCCEELETGLRHIHTTDIEC